VNGLSVFQLGDFTFSQPSRITANTRLGDGELVDIQREAKLGGSIHSKGVLILSSFLASRYAAEQPLSLTASLVFEQTYGPRWKATARRWRNCARSCPRWRTRRSGSRWR
jgi:predicted ATP-dependent protease